MKKKIIKIGNSRGIIIPQYFLEKIGSPDMVNISLIEGGIFIRSSINKSIRRKPRSEDETNALFQLMRAKLDNNIEIGKTKWINNRVMERKISF